MNYRLLLQNGGFLHWKDPLYRNSFLILTSYLASAGLGFIFWVIAAKFYPQEDVGVASALISSTLLLYSLSCLGLDQSLVRFFPEGNKSKIFSTSIFITTIIAVVFGIIFITGTEIWSPELGILNSSNAIVYLLILATTPIFILIGNSFIAMRKAEFSLLQNIISGSRIIFLIPLIFMGTMGIFGAYGVSIMIACTVMFLLLVRSGVTPIFTFDRTYLHDAFRFSAGNYLAGLLITVPTLILPIMILNLQGAEKTAYYYIAFAIASILFMIPSAVSTSLFVEGSHEGALKENTLKSLFIIIVLLIPSVIILYLFGGYILEVIGKSYAEGLDLLRILALSSFFVAIVNVYFSIKRVQKDMKGLLLLSSLLFVLLIGLSYFFVLKYGIMGVGFAWIGAYGLCSSVIGVVVWRGSRLR
jgi:O-antigen/teichoic acid export membrane protein